jgi:2-phosphoglycerate kinase
MSDLKTLCIAGPSGVGKSSLSYSLAQQLGLPITEVDDLFLAVESLTTPTQQPNIHYWKENPQAASQLPAERVLEIHLDVCRTLSPAISAVLDNHVDTQLPVILDGDFLLPEFMAAYSDKVKGLVIIEDEIDQIVKNYLLREPNQGMQKSRAEVSWLFGQWLSDECGRLGLPVISARPWNTVLARALSVLG